MVNIIKILLNIFCIIFMLWIAISNGIQAFKCPELTQTQLFLRIPQSFICNWKNY